MHGNSLGWHVSDPEKRKTGGFVPVQFEKYQRYTGFSLS